MNLFTPNTGDEKLDETYIKMQTHIITFNEFPKFEKYFLSIAQTDDMKRLNKWLLKVLFVQIRYPQDEKHKFDLLLEKIKKEDALKLEEWLDTKLKETGGAK